MNSASAETISCRYLSKGEPELISAENCLSPMSVGSWDALISKHIALDAVYDSRKLAYLYSEAGVFYFQENGKIMRTLMYDNGPDYFEEGLVRSLKDGKVGFMDKNLDLIIERKFDFAFPFKNGKAEVCVGCTRNTDGEYSYYEDGVWYYIDTKGKKID